MPLISIETIASGAQLGLWHIEESVDEQLNRYPSLSSEVSSYRSDARKLEKLAVYSLLFMMTGDTNLRISHNEGRSNRRGRRCYSFNIFKVYV